MKTSLIDEYLALTAICAETNYDDITSVKRHNNSVKRMYEIVMAVGSGQADVSIEQFSALLDIAENKTNIWVAAQLLEKVKTDQVIEAKALSIIHQVAKGDGAEALGFTLWLKKWNNE